MTDNKMETERLMAGVGPLNKEGKYDWKETIEPHIEIAVIGESGCGKTALILAAKNQIFPHYTEKLVTKVFCLEVEVDGEIEGCMVREGDLGSKIRSETDIILLCSNGKEEMPKWIEELKNRMHNVPIIAVRIEKKSEGFFQIDQSGSSEFMVCCPHAMEGCQEVFQEAVKKVKLARKSKAV